MCAVWSVADRYNDLEPVFVVRLREAIIRLQSTLTLLSHRFMPFRQSMWRLGPIASGLFAVIAITIAPANGLISGDAHNETGNVVMPLTAPEPAIFPYDPWPGFATRIYSVHPPLALISPAGNIDAPANGNYALPDFYDSYDYSDIGDYETGSDESADPSGNEAAYSSELPDIPPPRPSPDAAEAPLSQ